MEGDSKAKLLYVLQIMEKTDEDHPINSSGIIEKLRECGLDAERKSISRDIAALRDVGYSIISCEALRDGYFMTDHIFEDYEIKIMADALAGAKFLTAEDTENLVKKLGELASPTGEELLRGMTFIDPAIKSTNRLVRYNIDYVITAIKKGRRLNFQYYEKAPDGRRRLKRDGHVYEISPYYLVWINDEYFMIGNSKSHDHLTHFHVEDMTGTQVTDIPSRPRKEIEELTPDFSIGEYLRRNVNMYTGTELELTLRCSQCLAGDVTRRFGAVRMSPDRCGRFCVKVRANDSEGLLRWLMGYAADEMEVIGPESVREKLAERARASLELYGRH